MQSSGASDESAAIGRASGAADVVDVVGESSDEGAGVSACVRRCIRPWVTVDGLEMTTAMHAHAAIAVPNLF